MATRTGTVTKVNSDPASFTLTPDDPPPATIPFACTDRQYATALAAWGATPPKKIKVTYPDGGGAPTNVESA